MSLAPTVQLQYTPVPFLRNGGAVAVVFGTDPSAFVEVPGPVGDALLRGSSVAHVRQVWGQEAATVDHKLIGMMRYGLLRGDAGPEERRQAEGARSLVQESWVQSMERDDGGAVLAHTPTGNFVRTGVAAFQLWQLARQGAGIDCVQLPAQLRDVADLLLSSGMFRAVV
ncbi:hypothetical protein [Streptomyces sp. NBC_01465]|uniref:hypothetical protein n=1 Tax=Streptomyces sp. NBC_01465 TaxID=2903878 RepID=UPI002E33B23E|nr:hypothetical protein [Streptomyces sp. NBC_01465]